MIVGLIGRRRVGKDTAAAALTKDGFRVVKFADGLKIMLRALLKSLDYSDHTVERMLESDLKEAPIASLGGRTPRYLMQTLGTQWGRDIVAENVWVDVAMDRCRQFPNAVVSDCRFPNEAAAIRCAGGLLIRIERHAGQWNEMDAHSSEALIGGLPVDYLVLNNGTIEDLQENVRNLVAGTHRK